MTASERIKKYLSGQPVDRCPVIEWAPWWNLTVNRWHGEGLPAERKTVEEIQDYFGLDKCLQTGIGYHTPDTPKSAGHGQGIVADEADWENVKKTFFPPLDKEYWDKKFQRLQMTRERGDTINFLTVEGFFWYPRTLFGIENHLYSFYDYPELYHDMCEAYSDWLINVFRYVFSHFQFDFMSFAEDMSYNLGPMISKECFDEFLAPFYKKVIPVIHEYGIPVFIDSDGDITQAVDWYAEVGADGMFPLERKAGVDVSMYLDKQPQMAFIGHFDKMCMKYGSAAMREEFERILPSMKRGKVIVSVDHQTPPDVSIENYKEYVKLLFEYCEKATHENTDIKPCPVFDN
ncbi:MAG: hypothetical protein E7668_05300 [Ruminococcaceae bacterium]|nr:hypothetical protein [Oscillospiraceae bacterium]